jgi:hypothetical protein
MDIGLLTTKIQVLPHRDQKEKRANKVNRANKVLLVKMVLPLQ